MSGWSTPCSRSIRVRSGRRVVDSGWTAKAVAVHLGFPDATNFGRYFRSHTGLTPAAYAAREQRQETDPGPPPPATGPG